MRTCSSLPVTAVAALLAAASFVGCGSDDPRVEASADAGSPADAAAFDAGLDPEPDAGSCSVAECPPLACRIASCASGSCAYAAAEDGAACLESGEAGLCHAGSCRTAFRHTRGLCVVADFADATLEGHTGAGLRSLTDVRAMLEQMERHWWWLSLGTHRMEWELTRIRLDQPLSDEAFSDWAEYRDAVVGKLAETVDLGDFDADGDGLLDTMWVIASTHDRAPAYVMGGASRHLGANLFVDAQSSQSVAVGAYGNFNHEVCHNLGLPDLYGPFGTIGFLSLMHDSWALPANGLSAFDRMKLGWFEPRRIDQTTRRVELEPAEQAFSAVRVATARAAEYFLIEHRRRPEAGYGSAPAERYDGLAIFHVFEPGHQGMDPPLLKLEPADGAMAPDTFPQPADFWAPETGAGHFVARSHLTGGELFRIENLERTARGLRLDVVMLPDASSPADNLLANGSFEDGAGPLPDGWQTGAWLDEPDTFAWDTAIRHEGARSARISNLGAPNDAHFSQQVGGLTPGAPYLLCGWLRGEAIVGYEDASAGANLCLMGGWTRSPGPFGTFDWQEQCAAFSADSNEVTVGCRLGFYSSTATGTAWCDALTLTPLQSAF
ncbi:MAG TPA: hypothetical protein DFS52_19535 [Myxococcales bacterium]|nr:hypothetical protein [Myxococcales bacterium]